MAARFPTAWLDELYARADIVSIVSGYLQLKKDGRRYWGLCPFHNEKTPSFMYLRPKGYTNASVAESPALPSAL